MSETSTELVELICNRFMVAQEASQLSKKAFGEKVGLSPSQITNIKKYRNPPSHEAIHRAIREFGFTADWFFGGSRAGFRDEGLAARLRTAEAKLGLRV